MSLFLLMVMLGVANWFATTLVVESELLRPIRDWVDDRWDTSDGPVSATFWHKAHYLVHCHMCAGTWVGLGMALFAPPVVAVPFFGYVLTALVIKGIGHLVLLLNNMGNARIERDQIEVKRELTTLMSSLDMLEQELSKLQKPEPAVEDDAAYNHAELRPV